MPELELIDTLSLILKDQEYEPAHYQNVIITLSTMLYPESTRFREIHSTATYAKLSEHIAEKDHPFPITIGGIECLLELPELPSMPGRRTKGINAGYILHNILKCSRYHPGWASIATAFKLLSAELKRNNAERKDGAFNVSNSSLERDWLLMSTVAHLWCAYHDFGDEEWALPENFPMFLAWAECLRREGEIHYPPKGRLNADSPVKKRSTKPLLDPAKSWKVPGTIFPTLPPIIVPPEWEPLPKEALALLAQAKKY